MNHAAKVEAARHDLARMGLAESTWAPPLWKLMWRMGIDVPPPLFLGFWRNALLMGGLFGILWGIARRHRLPAWKDYAPGCAPDGRPVP